MSGSPYGMGAAAAGPGARAAATAAARPGTAAKSGKPVDVAFAISSLENAAGAATGPGPDSEVVARTSDAGAGASKGDGAAAGAEAFAGAAMAAVGATGGAVAVAGATAGAATGAATGAAVGTVVGAAVGAAVGATAGCEATAGDGDTAGKGATGEGGGGGGDATGASGAAGDGGGACGAGGTCGGGLGGYGGAKGAVASAETTVASADATGAGASSSDGVMVTSVAAYTTDVIWSELVSPSTLSVLSVLGSTFASDGAAAGSADANPAKAAATAELLAHAGAAPAVNDGVCSPGLDAGPGTGAGATAVAAGDSATSNGAAIKLLAGTATGVAEGGASRMFGTTGRAPTEPAVVSCQLAALADSGAGTAVGPGGTEKLERARRPCKARRGGSCTTSGPGVRHPGVLIAHKDAQGRNTQRAAATRPRALERTCGTFAFPLLTPSTARAEVSSCLGILHSLIACLREGSRHARCLVTAHSGTRKGQGEGVNLWLCWTRHLTDFWLASSALRAASAAKLRPIACSMNWRPVSAGKSSRGARISVLAFAWLK